MLFPLVIEIADDGRMEAIWPPFDEALATRWRAIGSQLLERSLDHVGNRRAIILAPFVPREGRNRVVLLDGNRYAILDVGAQVHEAVRHAVFDSPTAMRGRADGLTDSKDALQNEHAGTGAEHIEGGRT